MYNVVVKKFTFAISSADELLVNILKITNSPTVHIAHNSELIVLHFHSNWQVFQQPVICCHSQLLIMLAYIHSEP